MSILTPVKVSTSPRKLTVILVPLIVYVAGKANDPSEIITLLVPVKVRVIPAFSASTLLIICASVSVDPSRSITLASVKLRYVTVPSAFKLADVIATAPAASSSSEQDVKEIVATAKNNKKIFS